MPQGVLEVEQGPSGAMRNAVNWNYSPSRQGKRRGAERPRKDQYAQLIEFVLLIAKAGSVSRRLDVISQGALAVNAAADSGQSLTNKVRTTSLHPK